MRKQKTILKTFFIFMTLFYVSIHTTQAQELTLANNESTLKIYGTSSIHDWEEDAQSQSGSIKFSDIENGKIEALSIAIDAESLKSGKSAMDKNTYKALKTNKYKKILFQLTKVDHVAAKGQGVFDVKTVGNLTIAGTKQSISLNFKMTIVGNKVTLVGDKKIKMTDFNVEPPTALLGTITTGDDLTIKFKTNFK